MNEFYVKAIAFLGVALGMGLGAIGPSLGMGMVGKQACDSISKTPEHAGKIRATMMMAMAFIEACAIYSLLVCIVILIKT